MELTTAPTAEALASLVLIGPWDDVLDYWETRMGCVAWIETSRRRCARPAHDYLCTRHARTARTRWNKTQETTR